MSAAKPYDALALGEVMLRLSPEGEERIAQNGRFVKHAGGSELNVMGGIAGLGLRAGLISRLPDSPVGRYVRGRIRAGGVSDDYVLEDTAPGARLGLYYYENGAFPRKPQVTYDRAGSSFSAIAPGDLPPHLARLFHTSGITLALGEGPRQTAATLLDEFHAAGALVSLDVNYRARLWDEDTARAAICAILPMVDVLFVSEETSRRMMGKTGTLEEIQKQYADEYGIGVVASTQRRVNSPHNHDFSSCLYVAKTGLHYSEVPYRGIRVVDRIGSGDAYVSGVLYALLAGLPYQQCVACGNAAAALKNTIPGDLLNTAPAELRQIMADHQSGSASEMER